MVTKTLTYLGNSPRPFGIRTNTGFKAAFNPAKDKTLTLEAIHADGLLSAEPGLWSEVLPPAPAPVPVIKEKTEVKKVNADGNHTEGL
jgi:hypothetical protein